MSQQEAVCGRCGEAPPPDTRQNFCGACGYRLVDLAGIRWGKVLHSDRVLDFAATGDPTKAYR